MNKTIQYVITWLLYGDAQAAKLVGYTDDEEEAKKYKIVIRPNGHWGKEIVLPDMESPKMEGNVITTDIVYTAFFFISRAEELINPERDEHGRFLARYSILGEKNRLMIPLLDEYARFLMKALELPLPKVGYHKIFLTHDIDSTDQYRHLRGAIGGILRGEWRRVLASWQDIHNDPLYTFPWLMEQDDKVKRSEGEVARVVYFVKHTKGKGYDYPQYSRHSKAYVRLRTALRRNGAIIGIHSSYYGFSGHTDHQYHRSHYLRCSIENMEHLLLGSGVTQDFTMGFPDMAGFRLQTTRSVRWINPNTWTLTDLKLHPLMIMDCTLYEPKYMGLSEDEAYFYCSRILEKVRQNAGDLCILWHNASPSKNPMHFSLYERLIEMIIE